MRYLASVTVVSRMVLGSPTIEEARRRAQQRATELPGVRAWDLVDVSVRALSTSEAMRGENLRIYQEHTACEAHGTPSQRQRWALGLLPDHELLAIARAELFTAFAGFPRRARLGSNSIPHPRAPDGSIACGSPVSEIPVDWVTLAAPSLSQPEWDSVLRMGSAVLATRRHPWLTGSVCDPVTVALREHKGTCRVCGATRSDRSAHVSVSWAGRTLTREYSL